MGSIQIFQVDAFADRLFSGNPAAVCPLTNWLSDELLQSIASENNLSETAFFVGHGNHYKLRWFTPVTEVALCGHATLAAAFVLFHEKAVQEDVVYFHTVHRGVLSVSRQNGLLTLNLPSDRVEQVRLPQQAVSALGLPPHEAFEGKTDLLLVYETETQITGLRPDFRMLATLGWRGIVVTAPGETCDFVSRFFAPGSGIDEDPVTGSAHTLLTPFWAARLGKQAMQARQLSARGGSLWCRDLGSRTEISGRAVLYMKGTLRLP